MRDGDPGQDGHETGDQRHTTPLDGVRALKEHVRDIGH